MRWDEIADQKCSVARTMSILGDRWTMLLIREAFLGTRRFDEFTALTGASPQVVAARLARLVEAGILHKTAYQQRPARYEYRLTRMGLDLQPVLIAIAGWGDKWLNDGEGAPNPLRHTSCGAITRPLLICDQCGEPVTVTNVINEPSDRLVSQRREMLDHAAVGGK